MSWWARAQVWLRGAVWGETKSLAPDLDLATASGAALPAEPRYPTQRSMSALCAHPWVRAAVQAIVDDLSGVPLIAMRDGEQLEDHPVLEILRRPNSQCSGTRFRRQLIMDWSLPRNAYIRVIRDDMGQLVTVSRIHPGHIKADVDPADGLVTRWKIQNAVFLPPEDVLHIADVSWSDTIDGIYGASVVKTIDLGITADLDVRKQAGRAARRGRLEFLIRPSNIQAATGKRGTQGIKESYEKVTSEGDGLWVIGKPMEVTPLSLTPKDLEFEKLLTMTRDEVIALFGVPPVRIGLPGANYGTAKQQMRTYWEHLRHIARLFDDELSKLTTDGATIHHDFTDVEALQTSYTERQMRASVWITAFGMTPADAARYEGFVDAPIPEDAVPEDMRAPRRPATEVEEPQAAADPLAGVLQRWAGHYQALSMNGGLPGDVRLGLRLDLERHGHLDRQQASQLADLIHGSVCEYVRTVDADGPIGVASLRCFSPDVVQALRALEAA